ncbi:hypothetical protein QFC22_001194 [Naganishia vaughanmartiniae]|uniref:Uncharacterized protein n=1 Tax=Naganishia vaughanmartiniae TaxID=1424756 RepID=A0ACC2XM19_9TREE|nr:hypothetical protein QFC22_001194 [Naganishia vaughanmartiniae]
MYKKLSLPKVKLMVEPTSTTTTTAPTTTVNLPLLAFNDVYRVTQKYSVPAGHATRTPQEGDQPGAGAGAGASAGANGKNGDEYISVAQFGRTLLDIRDSWRPSSSGEEEEDAGREGLVLFAGDGECLPLFFSSLSARLLLEMRRGLFVRYEKGWLADCLICLVGDYDTG